MSRTDEHPPEQVGRKVPWSLFAGLTLASAPILWIVSVIVVFWRLSDLSDERIDIGQHASWSAFMLLPLGLAALIAGALLLWDSLQGGRNSKLSVEEVTRSHPRWSATINSPALTIGLGAMALIGFASVIFDLIGEVPSPLRAQPSMGQYFQL